MNRKLLMLIALLGLTTWAAAENKWELRERDNTYDVSIDESNVIQGASINGNAATASALAADPSDCSAGQFANAIGADGSLSCSDDGSGLSGVVAGTADALSADPADCSANQFANAIASDGDLTCAAIGDADVPNDITIDNAGTADALSANGSNCSAGSLAAGVDAAGAAEGCADPILESELASLADLNTQLGTSIADGAHTVDTSANTECSGSTTYLDGEGNCDDISSVYQAASSVLDYFQLRDTSANICAATPTGAGYVAISSDEYDLFVSTGAGVGDWRNSRTGAGACQ